MDRADRNSPRRRPFRTALAHESVHRRAKTDPQTMSPYHLTSPVGSEVEITLEIHAPFPDGAGDKLVRDVTEIYRMLKFADFGLAEDQRGKL